MNPENDHSSKDNELEVQILCAIAEAVSQGRSVDNVCRTAIKILMDLMTMQADGDLAGHVRRDRH